MNERRYAVLIASSRFPDYPGLEDLKFPENDVDRLDEVLKDPARGAFTDTVVLKNPLYLDAIIQIRQMLKKASVNDLSLIYYAGHGKQDLYGRLCLAMTNTRIDLLEDTSVPLERIKTMMTESPLKKKVLILDCCFSGLAGDAFRSGVDDQLNMISRGGGTYIMTATDKYESARERESEGHGVFTRHLIEGIRTGDADLNEDGWITMDELYNYVHDQVCQEGCQEPMKWNMNVKGEVVIARSGKSMGKKRYTQIRDRLLDLARQDILTDAMLSQAIAVNAMKVSDMSGDQLRYHELLSRFQDRDITGSEFIIEWHKLSELTHKGGHEKVRIPVPKTLKPPVQESGGEKKDEASPQTRITNNFGMEFVYIQPGTFKMGSPSDEPGRFNHETLHEVTLTRAFYMQTTPITQGQWQQLMGSNPSFFKACGSTCPVENVSWNDVQEFIKKLNDQEGREVYRLPTEAEWEYACRAGTTTALYSGPIKIEGERNAPALDPIAWYGGNSGVEYEGGYDSSGWKEKQYSHKRAGTHPVSQKQPNARGLYDMIGNVWEWCEDWYGNYPDRPITDPTGPDKGSNRVLRGGSWNSYARHCRSANRDRSAPGVRLDLLGARLARSLP
jgi:formylglycine-generating enzyme required for sulfatase activity